MNPIQDPQREPTQDFQRIKLHRNLKKTFFYDPLTGFWMYKINGLGRINKGRIVSHTPNREGYCSISFDGLRYRTARLAIFYMTGHFPKGLADHRNRIRDDDRWENLRDVTPKVNSNNHVLYPNNTSGVNGVWLDKTTMKYRSYINNKDRNNKDRKRNRKNLGYFDTIQEATFARIQALKKLS